VKNLPIWPTIRAPKSSTQRSLFGPQRHLEFLGMRELTAQHYLDATGLALTQIGSKTGLAAIDVGIQNKLLY
jgi:hypothetical protein